MSYTYLLESGEASSAERFADIPASAPSKSNRSAAKYSFNGSATASCPAFRFGRTSAHLTASRGKAASTSSAADSPVRTFQPQTERPSELQVPKVPSGKRWRALLTKLRRLSSLPKTARCSKSGESIESFLTSTQWATVRNALNSALKITAKPREKGFGFWGCVVASSRTNGQSPKTLLTDTYGTVVSSVNRRFLESFGHVHPPEFAEWAMEFPIGWTDCRPLGTRKFLSWLRAHSRC